MKIAQERGITLGRHLENPGGIFDPIEDVSELATRLHQHNGRGAWWAPGIFADDYRKQENWLGTWTLGVDGDYYAQHAGHSAPPAESRVLVAPALAGVISGALFHETPRGFRSILLLDRFIDDAEEYAAIVKVIQLRIERALLAAGIFGEVQRKRDVVCRSTVVVEREGFVVDTGALFDRARLYFTPNATVADEASPRKAEVFLLGGAS